jgi:hypothetical protein
MGLEPDGLSLAVLQDGSPYRFGLDQPLHPRMLQEALDLDGGYNRRYPRRQGCHADQLRLLSGQR